MLNLTYTDKPDFGEYEENIRATGTALYVDPIRYHFAVTNFRGQYISAQARLQDYIRVMSQGQYNEVKPDAVRLVLQQYCAIDPKHFLIRDRGQKKISMDMRKVVDPLLERLAKYVTTSTDPSTTMAYVLLSAYKEFVYYKTKTQNGDSKQKRFVPCDKVSNLGIKLCEIPFYYERQSTSRYYTKNDNVQAFDLKTVNAFTVPKDYVLVWADFSQIDFRVAYHVILREAGSKYDEYYRSVEDKYEALARAIWDFCGKPFDSEAFRIDRKGIKTSILARVYGASLNTISANFRDPEMGVMLDKYVRMNPGHQAYLSAINRAIQFNIEVIAEDYFGVTREIPTTTGGYQTTDSALNSPIQSTSNSIIVHWTNAIIRQFRERGWDEDKVRVYLIRHDETLFMVHKDAMRDSWIFQNNSQVQIDDWEPLDIELDMGYYYTVSDEDVRNLYEESCKLNQHRITPKKNMPPRPTKFQPIKDVLTVYCYSPSTLEGFLKNYVQVGYEQELNREFKSDSERLAWLDEGIASGKIAPNSALWYYRQCLGKYIIFKPGNSHWCMVESMQHVLGTALKNNCAFVDIKCVDTSFNTSYDNLYIRYSVASAMSILRLYNEFEASGGEHNKWLPYRGDSI